MTSRFGRRTLVTAGAFAIFGHVTSRSGSHARQTAERPLIAVSFPILADIVRNIAGDGVDVISIIPKSGDPHSWEASPQDLVRVSEASLFISMGASLEAFVESGGWRRVVRDGGVPELVIADHLDLIAVDKVIDHGDHVHDLREGDPHVWLDPAKVIEMVPVIQYSLEVSFPEQGSAIADAATTYLGLLHELNDEMEHDLGTIPVERRRLVVFHDAFTYFSARFGFEVIGVVLANSNAEPSAGELATLIETVGEACLSVAFAEPQLNRDVLELIADETGIGIGELLTDSFAGQVESYLALMRFNRDSLVRHLVTEWRDRC